MKKYLLTILTPLSVVVVSAGGYFCIGWPLERGRDLAFWYFMTVFILIIGTAMGFSIDNDRGK